MEDEEGVRASSRKEGSRQEGRFRLCRKGALGMKRVIPGGRLEMGYGIYKRVRDFTGVRGGRARGRGICSLRPVSRPVLPS